MSLRKHRITNPPGTLLGIGVVLVALSLLAGCKSSGTVAWKEDRAIPFSPDDRAIAYRHRDAIFVARTQGDKHRRVFTAESGSSVSTPHWAPGQRAVVFAVSNGKQDTSSGLLSYALWYWPAPEDIWISDGEQSKGDTAKLPSNWTPASPKLLTAAHFRAAIQIEADALFRWHPDGDHILFLDTDAAGLQTVMSVDVDAHTRSVASPIRAASLAFSVSPSGEYLISATKDPDADALWLGPVGEDADRWKIIEKNPAPAVVPRHDMDDADIRGRSGTLYDLRPRLGIWSKDSRWIAHLRTPPELQSQSADTESSKTNPARQLVLTRVASDKSQRILTMPEGKTADLHWSPDERRLGLLSNRSLLLVDPESGSITALSGTLQVQQFMGWSRPGTHLAYLTPAEEFAPVDAAVPIGRVVWAPAPRHNLMIARPDGTNPENRFGLMNVSYARWGNQSEKLSFWATHLPTVSNLPPGDPAAVLDLDEDAIRWYPTDIAEYSQVGHYYLLNRQYADAVKFYSDALSHVEDRDRDRTLVARIRLWRGLARLASGDGLEAEEDLNYFRAHIIPTKFEIPSGWDEAVYRALSTDRIFLSTLLSMGQIGVAVDEAARIIEQDQDARHIQGLCYLAMIDRAIGQHELFTEGVVTELVPRVMQSEQIPRERADRLITTYISSALHPYNQRFLSVRSKKRLAEKLVELAESMRDTYPQHAVRLSESAAVFYRESGETALEMVQLRAAGEM